MKEIKINCSYVKVVKIKELIPHPQNPNQHTEKQVKILAKLIQVHGWRRAITISSLSGHIIRGHGLFEAAKLLKLENVPVDIQQYDTEKDELADLVADNQIKELSEFDPKILIEIIDQLESENVDMEIAGFDEGTLERIKFEYGLPDFDFKEFDEEAAKDVKKVVCPQCGKEFPI